MVLWHAFFVSAAVALVWSGNALGDDVFRNKNQESVGRSQCPSWPTVLGNHRELMWQNLVQLFGSLCFIERVYKGPCCLLDSSAFWGAFCSKLNHLSPSSPISFILLFLSLSSVSSLYLSIYVSYGIFLSFLTLEIDCVPSPVSQRP